MALVAAVLWILAPALSHLALYLTNPSDPRLELFGRVNLIAAGCVVLSLAMYGYLRTGARDPERVMDLALLFMVAMTFSMGVLIHWARPWFVSPQVEPMITWSGPSSSSPPASSRCGHGRCCWRVWSPPPWIRSAW